MNEHIYKNHNKSLLLYPAKYRREVFTEGVSQTLKEVCPGLSGRYEVRFVEIGMKEDHVHFLIQSVPALSVTQIVKMLKSITAKQIFQLHPEVSPRYFT